MYYWIIYDISKDTARTKVAKRCKQIGLRRVQKSVFLGPLKSKAMESLRTEFNRHVNWRTDQVFFVPMTQLHYTSITRTGPGKGQRPLLPPRSVPNFY